ncbi:MAG: hypothetical protein MJY99_09290 [Fibrobacter sp.]|nr:hypothetical protein [Fibrobacter sp.]
MKVMSFCVAILAALAWSNIFTLSGSLSFEKGYLNIDTTKTCNVDTTYINCSLENGLAYYSTLDTAIAVFFQPRYATGVVATPSPFTNTVNYSHTFTEVMRYEFMNWVEWGIVVMDKDSAKRLLDRVLPESVNIGSCSIVHKKVCDDDPSLCNPLDMCYGGGAGGGVSDEQAACLPTKKFQIDEASVPSETPKSEQPGDTATASETPMSEQSGDTMSSADSLGNPLWFAQSASLTESVALGTHYRVFDMNGVHLRDGVWQGRFNVSGKPVIIRFSNGLTQVVK